MSIFQLLSLVSAKGIQLDSEKNIVSKAVLDFSQMADQWLIGFGVPEDVVFFVKLIVDVIILVALCFLADRLAKRILLKAIRMLVLKSKNQWDDVLLEKRVFDKLAHIAPILIIQLTADYVFSDIPEAIPSVLKFTNIIIMVIVMRVITSFLHAVEYIFSQLKAFKDKPIGSYFQLGRIGIYAVGFILILSAVVEKDPTKILGAFGALTAVTMLVFKDTILGFVASIQLAANDMVRVGDWVSMPKFGADGNIVKITLNTIKVQNWDKTISTVPTYAFVSDSFKNWRGMSEAGGRRISRSLVISLTSIKYCDNEMLNTYRQYHLLEKYIDKKTKEIENYNKEKNINKTHLINGRHLTNIGVFRAYAQEYINSLPNISKEMTSMVFQQAPTENGIPIQIYCFTNTTVWAEFENIQADIFDHLLAAANAFELEIYQSPSGGDFKQLMQK